MTLAAAHYLLGMYLFAQIIVVLMLCWLDHRRRRSVQKEPAISVLIPAYNEAGNIDRCVENALACVKTLTSSYEICILDDASTDNTYTLCCERAEQDPQIRVFQNKENSGKTVSLNSLIKQAQYEYLLCLDADITLNTAALEDIVKRLQKRRSTAIVSSGYIAGERGLSPLLNGMEYIAVMLFNGSFNVCGAPGAFGGCMAIKRSAIAEIGLFAPHQLAEDGELAVRALSTGYDTKISFYPVATQTPHAPKPFINQKLRWSGGMSQIFFTHWDQFLKHPVFLLLTMMFMAFITTLFAVFMVPSSLVSSFANTFFGFLMYSAPLSALFAIFVYPLFSLPYVFWNMKGTKEWYKWAAIYPFSIIYTPCMFFVYLFGFIRGIYIFFTAEKGVPAWKAEQAGRT